MTLGAILLSMLTVWIDGLLGREDQPDWLQPLTYSGGPDGAREVLGVIAGSMITIAGVVFSITIVALTLASGQFGPRLLSNFMRDRGNQITLGTFIATFLYSLLVLRTIRNDSDQVPDVSITIALVLVVASLSVLIYFIHHISVTIQAPNLVAAVGRELQSATERLFPDSAPEETTESEKAREGLARLDDEESAPIRSTGSGYIEVVDLDGLIAVAQDHDLVLRIRKRPGSFVVRGTSLIDAFPAHRVDDSLSKKLAGSVATGPQRTPSQDIEFPVEQMVEIAVRALSPSINDPFTAATCVDQLSVGLCLLAEREFPSANVTDSEGNLRILIADPVTWDGLIHGAFGQIRQCAGFHAEVYVRMLESLHRIGASVRTTDRLPPIHEQGQLIVEAASVSVPAAADRRVIEAKYAELLADLQETDVSPVTIHD